MEVGCFVEEAPEILASYFQESLIRVLATDSFIEDFYEHFFQEHPELQHFFVGKNLVQIQKKLKTTLQLLRAQNQNKPGILNYLKMLGRMHAKLGVHEEDFQLWKEALLQTIVQFDPDYSAQTLRAWEYALDSIIANMQVPPASASLAVS